MGRIGMGVLLAALVLVGCAEPTFPRDAEGTLEHVMSGAPLRVGASDNPPWTEVADDGTVSGVEAEIVRGWADSLGSEVVWTPGAESQLVLLLEEGELDVVIGGLRSDSPWSKRVALTRPHAASRAPDGSVEQVVLASRLGENAVLTNLERFLIDEGYQP